MIVCYISLTSRVCFFSLSLFSLFRSLSLSLSQASTIFFLWVIEINVFWFFPSYSMYIQNRGWLKCFSDLHVCFYRAVHEIICNTYSIIIFVAIATVIWRIVFIFSLSFIIIFLVLLWFYCQFLAITMFQRLKRRHCTL